MIEQPTPDAERTVMRAHPARAEAASPRRSAAGKAVAPADAGRRRWYARIWSDLNLNGPVPARVRPAIGEWGPLGLPSTKQKKRARWLAPVLFTLMLAALVLLGWFFWTVFK